MESKNDAEKSQSALTKFLFNIVQESRTPIEKDHFIMIAWEDKAHFYEWWNARSATPEERKSQKLKDLFIMKAKSCHAPFKFDNLKQKREDVCLLCGTLFKEFDEKEIRSLTCFFCTAVSETDVKNDYNYSNVLNEKEKL